PGREAVQFIDTMQAWSKEFSDTIQALRREFLAPLDKAEADLIHSVDEAFSQVARGNSAISAHLASLRRVQQTQDSLLNRANMTGLRQKIQDGLSQASDNASNVSQQLDRATKALDELKAKAKIK